jgi:eukaryotic-like serine/threonine-protein kinase
MPDSSPPMPQSVEPEATPEVPARPADWVTPPIEGEVITSLATGNSYTMGEKIGEGFFGMVYACVDTWSNDLAAKVMKPLAPYEKVKASTEAELGKLVFLRHPYITYVFDAFEYRDTFYIITERCYCPLTSLFSIVEDFKGTYWIKAVARCLLQAVQYIHNNQYVHQDIHLGNVFAAFAKDEMITEQPGAIHFKLGDLGVAKLFSEIDATNTRALWMLPPEVLDSSEFGPLEPSDGHLPLRAVVFAYSARERATIHSRGNKRGQATGVGIATSGPIQLCAGESIAQTCFVSHGKCHGTLARLELTGAA